jgi:hypothetical protein
MVHTDRRIVTRQRVFIATELLKRRTFPHQRLGIGWLDTQNFFVAGQRIARLV